MSDTFAVVKLESGAELVRVSVGDGENKQTAEVPYDIAANPVKTFANVKDYLRLHGVVKNVGRLADAVVFGLRDKRREAITAEINRVNALGATWTQTTGKKGGSGSLRWKLPPKATVKKIESGLETLAASHGVSVADIQAAIEGLKKRASVASAMAAAMESKAESVEVSGS
jgi:hypothetical protein